MWLTYVHPFLNHSLHHFYLIHLHYTTHKTSEDAQKKKNFSVGTNSLLVHQPPNSLLMSIILFHIAEVADFQFTWLGFLKLENNGVPTYRIYFYQNSHFSTGYYRRR